MQDGGRNQGAQRRARGEQPTTRVQAAEPGLVRSQALVRWARALGPQCCPVGAEAAASSAAPRGLRSLWAAAEAVVAAAAEGWVPHSTGAPGLVGGASVSVR